MAALGWKADTPPGRMSALTDTGRSEVLEPAKFHGSFGHKRTSLLTYRAQTAAMFATLAQESLGTELFAAIPSVRFQLVE